MLALRDLYVEFGYHVPAAFYNALLGALTEDNEAVGRRLFKNKQNLMQDRLWDAVLHAMLLVTPIGLYVHSVFSQHGLRFVHLMNCSCKIEPREDEPPFHMTLDTTLKPASTLQKSSSSRFGAIWSECRNIQQNQRVLEGIQSVTVSCGRTTGDFSMPVLSLI